MSLPGISAKSSDHSASKAKQSKGIDNHIQRSLFNIIDNRGGGDCLFYALENPGLSKEAMKLVRLKVAEQRLHMNFRPEHNAHEMIATLSQTPSIGEAKAGRMMLGKHQVPSATLAKLQATMGVYAGPSEMQQWCRWKHKRVGVVDFDGTLSLNTAAGMHILHYTPHDKLSTIKYLLANTDLSVYKSPNHYVRIVGLKNEGMESTELASQNKNIVSITNASTSFSKLVPEAHLAFQFFGLKIGTFTDLDKKWRRVALALHPDKQAGKSLKEKEQIAKLFRSAREASELLKKLRDNPELTKEIVHHIERISDK